MNTLAVEGIREEGRRVGGQEGRRGGFQRGSRGGQEGGGAATLVIKMLMALLPQTQQTQRHSFTPSWVNCNQISDGNRIIETMTMAGTREWSGRGKKNKQTNNTSIADISYFPLIHKP